MYFFIVLKIYKFILKIFILCIYIFNLNMFLSLCIFHFYRNTEKNDFFKLISSVWLY
jgi:hypothetical protein